MSSLPEPEAEQAARGGGGVTPLPLGEAFLQKQATPGGEKATH